MKAMILAAGRGERMRPLTDTVPKPLLEVGGKPLIVHHIERLAESGIRQIIINLAYKGQQIEAQLGGGAQFGVEIKYSHEDDLGLETAGGVINALPLLGSEPFILLSADLSTDYPFEALSHKIANPAHLVMVPNPDFNLHGDFYLSGKTLCHQGEQSLTYANIGLFQPSYFSGYDVQRLALGSLLHQSVKQGLLTGELYLGRWENVGTAQQLAKLNQSV